MEENNTKIENNASMDNLNKSPMHDIYQNHPKKFKAIIICAILLLAVLITLYFLNKKQIPQDVPITPEQAKELIDSVAKKTDEQGLPPAKKQLDIMKYNSQE
jgi:hypothetical protein